MPNTSRATFIREWRKYRGLTLEQLAEKAGTDHGNLSKIERGLKTYKQKLLEGIAAALDTTPASLLGRNPYDQEEIGSLWQDLTPADRERGRDLLEALKRSSERVGLDHNNGEQGPVPAAQPPIKPNPGRRR